MKKSAYSELRNRGFITDKEIIKYSHLSYDDIIAYIQSNVPIERTIAAKLISKNKNILFISPLINALLVEKKLYSKIAISEALGNLGDVSIIECIPYLGKIGNNQYKTLPNKPFEKSNYPLPRDIMARTICKAGNTAIPILLENLDTKNIKQLSEGIDALGYISYYQKNTLAKEYILNLTNQYKENDLILWKLVRALQAFHSNDVIKHLRLIMEQTDVQQLKWETKRSLLQINRRSQGSDPSPWGLTPEVFTKNI